MDKTQVTIKCLAANKSILDFDWSKDDETIFYICNLGQFFQIWSIPSKGGYPRQVTFFEDADVKGLKVSPDGNSIAFIVDYDGKEDYNLFVIPSSGGEPVCLSEDLRINLPVFTWSPDSSKIALLADRSGNLNVAVIDVKTKEADWLTDTSEIKMDLDWSGDGKWIAYTCYQGHMSSDIYLINPQSRETVNLTLGLGGENTGVAFSPDGKYAAFSSNARGDKNVVIMEIETRYSRWMPEKKCERTFLRWNHKADKFAYIENIDAQLAVYEWDFPPKSARRINPSGFLARNLKYSNDDSKIAIDMNQAVRTTEIFIKEQKSFRKLTDSMVYGLESHLFSSPEHITYKSFDDLEIPALYYKPDTEDKFPVLVWIHGGPTAQHFNGWDPFIQLFLLNGIGVLAPNPRGSTGYGKEFEDKTYYDWGGGDLQDIAYAVEFLRQDPQVDADKIIAGGGSYGGYLTMMAVSKKPDLWAAGINIMGIVNLKTFYEETASWLQPYLTEKYGFKDPEEDIEFYTERSPINFVDSIKCPLLLLYGQNDPRVPIGELKQLSSKLDSNQITYEEEILAIEGHSLNRLESRLLVFEKMLNFIKKYVTLSDETISDEADVQVDIPDIQEMSVQEESDLSKEATEEEDTKDTDTAEIPLDSVELPELAEDVSGSLDDLMDESDEVEIPPINGFSELPEIPEIPQIPDFSAELEEPAIEEAVQDEAAIEEDSISAQEQEDIQELDDSSLSDPLEIDDQLADLPEMPDLDLSEEDYDDSQPIPLSDESEEEKKIDGDSQEDDDFDIPDIPELPIFE